MSAASWVWGLVVLVGVALAVAALATVGLSWAVRRLRGEGAWRHQTASQQPSAPQADGHLHPRSWRPGDGGP
jgi:hypothetical protein